MDETSDRKVFMYLDPPYDIKDNLYGKKGSMHKGFDHDLFAQHCNECSLDSLVSITLINLSKIDLLIPNGEQQNLILPTQ